MAPSTLLESADNPYRSSVQWETTVSRRTYTDADLVELRAFVGPRADHFLRKWLPRLEDPASGDVGFSWISLFFPVYWLGFRKMYKAMLLLLVVTLILTIAPQFVFVNLLKLERVPLGVAPIIGIMINFVCGLYGNAWYLNHAEATIARSKQEGHIGDQLLITLMQRGGTSALGIAAAFVLSVVFGAVGGVIIFLAHFAS